MVKDHELRLKRKASGAQGGNPALLNQEDNQDDNQGFNQKEPPSSSSSSSPSSSSAGKGKDIGVITPPSPEEKSGDEFELTPEDPGHIICPHQKIISLYHEILPPLPAVRIWNDEQRGFLRKRWREDPERQSLEWWRSFFEYVSKSPFLMGKKSDFSADLEWLVRPRNFAKIANGRYHRDLDGGGKVSDTTRQNVEAAKNWLKKEEERDG